MITISLDSLNRSVKVLALVEHRIGAKLVEQFMADVTPQEEYQEVAIA